jgi:hypothetical protein
MEITNAENNHKKINIMKTKINQFKASIENTIGNTSLKKSIAFLAVGILFSLNTSAKVEGTPKTVVVEDANKTIKEQINKEEKVNVVFTVNETGNINLVVANTTNDKLKKSIETQFAKLKLSNLKANNAYSVVFNFKTI